MAQTIVLTNQKGGVGKTTSSTALAAGLVRKGKRVLSVDMDPQGNLGFCVGMDIEEVPTIYDALKGDASIYEVIYRSAECGDVIMSNILLSSAESELKGENRQLLLRDLLSQVEGGYDFIIIDTPPAFNLLTLNGYGAADYLVIPMAAEILSLVGLVQLKETIQAIQQSVNPGLNVMGILLTKYDPRRQLSRDVLEMADAVAGQLGTKVFHSKIRSSVTVAEAPAHGVSILKYAPRSNPAKDYQAFVEEVLQIVKEG